MSWFSGSTEKLWKYDDLPTFTLNNEEGLKKEAENILETRYRWLKQGKTWTVFYDEDNILVEERPVRDSSITMIRATTVLKNVDIEKILNWVYKSTYEEKRVLSDDINSHNVEKVINENVRVGKSVYNGKMGVSNREFLTLRTYKKLDAKNYIVAIQSINVESIPFGEGVVRGSSNCGTFLELLDNGDVKIITVDHIDPRGWVPSFVVNAYKKKAVERLQKLQEHFKNK